MGRDASWRCDASAVSPHSRYFKWAWLARHERGLAVSAAMFVPPKTWLQSPFVDAVGGLLVVAQMQIPMVRKLKHFATASCDFQRDIRDFCWQGVHGAKNELRVLRDECSQKNGGEIKDLGPGREVPGGGVEWVRSELHFERWRCHHDAFDEMVSKRQSL